MLIKQIIIGLSLVFCMNLINNIIGKALFNKNNHALNSLYAIMINAFFVYFSFLITIFFKKSFMFYTVILTIQILLILLYSIFILIKRKDFKSLINVNIIDLGFLFLAYFLMITSLSSSNLYISSDGYYYASTVEILKSSSVLAYKSGIVNIVSGDIIRFLNTFLYYHAYLAKIVNVEGLIFVNRILPMVVSYYFIISIKAVLKQKSFLFYLFVMSSLVVFSYSINEYKTLLNTPALGSSYGGFIIAAFIYAQKEEDFSFKTLFILNVFAIYLSALLFAFTFLFSFVIVLRKFIKDYKKRIISMISLLILGILCINVYKELTKDANNIFLSIFQGSYLLNAPYGLQVLSPVTVLIFVAVLKLYKSLKMENYLKEVFLICSLPFINSYVTSFLEPNYFIGLRSWAILLIILIFYFAETIILFLEKNRFYKFGSIIIMAFSILIFSFLPINVHIYESLELSRLGPDYFQATMSSRSLKPLSEENGLHPFLNDLKDDLSKYGNSCFINREYKRGNEMFYLGTVFETSDDFYNGSRSDCTDKATLGIPFEYAIALNEEEANAFFKKEKEFEIYYNEKWDLKLYIYKYERIK